MVGWHRDNSYSNSNFSNLKNWGNATFQTEFSSKEEKVLPRTTKIAAAIGLIYFALTILCVFSLFQWIRYF